MLNIWEKGRSVFNLNLFEGVGRLTFIFFLEQSLFAFLIDSCDDQLVVELDRRAPDRRHSTLVSIVKPPVLENTLVMNSVIGLDPHAFSSPFNARPRTRDIQLSSRQFREFLSIRIA